MCAVLKDWVSGCPRACTPRRASTCKYYSIEDITLTRLLLSQLGLLTLLTGCAGVLGLAFKWLRALRAFTLLAWLTTALAIVQLALLAACTPDDIAGWALWLPTCIAALPAALLSSTLHILKYWRGSPLVTEFTSPLVNSQPPAGAWDPAPMPRVNLAPRTKGGTPSHESKPVWPPPSEGTAAHTPGADMEAGATNAAKDSVVWPPPGGASR